MKKVLLILSLFFILSCHSSSYDCQLDVIPKVNVTENGDTLNNVNLVGYAFVADTLTARVGSYDDAKNGIIEQISDNAKINSYRKGEYTNETNIYSINNIDVPHVMVVMCDTVNKVYAYRNFVTDRGLKKLTVKLDFFVWKLTTENPVYKDGSWSVRKFSIPNK